MINKLMDKKILVAILVVLVAIAGSLAWIVQDRKHHNDVEEAEQNKELEFRAHFLGMSVEQLRADDKEADAVAAHAAK